MDVLVEICAVHPYCVVGKGSASLTCQRVACNKVRICTCQHMPDNQTKNGYRPTTLRASCEGYKNCKNCSIMHADEGMRYVYVLYGSVVVYLLRGYVYM